MRLLRIASESEISAPSYSGDLILPPTFIYDAFLLSLADVDAIPVSYRNMAREYVYKIRDYLVSLFQDLMFRQVKKYAGNPGRIRPGSEDTLREIIDSKDFDRLSEAFDQHTIRSSYMNDENGNPVSNERWKKIADKVQDLKKSENPAGIINDLTYSGGLYNLVHNTKTPVLGKFRNNTQLLSALNLSANAKDPQTLYEYASPGVVMCVKAEKSVPKSKFKNYSKDPNYYGD